jgi:hypothetical protein
LTTTLGSLWRLCVVPTYSRYFKDILANKYEIATLGVDHVKMSEECSVAIANGLEKQKDPGFPMLTVNFRQHRVLVIHWFRL